MLRFLKWTGIVLVVMAVLGVGSSLGLYYWAARDLPGFKSITDYTPPLVTTVYSRNGEVLGYFYKEKRYLVTLTEMPSHLAKAFLAAEDSNFYYHDGVDIQAVARAFVTNLRAGSIRQGGSTITQQVIKNLLLTSETSYRRKLKEAILAYRLERYLTKDEILTIYLNHIYLGGGAYGVEAAARTYFAKHVGQLTLAESAMLAGLPQAPSRYNPYSYVEAAEARQRYVLGRMLELDWISRQEYDQALAENLELGSMEDPSWETGAYYLEEVRRWLIDRYGEDMVYKGGLHVFTAVDLKHQAAAEKAVKQGLLASTQRRGWRGPLYSLRPEEYSGFPDKEPVDDATLAPGEWVKVLVEEVAPEEVSVRFGDNTGFIPVETMAWARKPDPSKAPEEVPDIEDASRVLEAGDVVWAEILEEPVRFKNQTTWKLALRQKPEVEGALVSLEPDSGNLLALVGGYDFSRSQFNRATQAKRQPGSAFKPIVYSAALDNGLTPASVILDAPFVFNDPDNDHRWTPENFEGVFYGPTLLRTALVKSRNLVTIRVARKIGLQKVLDRASALGLPAEDYPRNLSVALGSGEVSLYELCRAYTGFARYGSYVQPRLVLKVASAWGEHIYEADTEAVEAISPQTAYIIVKLMQEVVAHGTGFRARALGRPVAGKTGTTNEERDAWFMGMTPYLLSGVYVGFDDNQPMGKYETGSRAASPIWLAYRQEVEEDYAPQDFMQPPEVSMVRVDAENGLLAGPGTVQSYFLPFKSGTEPVHVSEGEAVRTDGGDTTSEDLFKQVF
jgi:penicillin-binding protein 1A